MRDAFDQDEPRYVTAQDGGSLYCVFSLEETPLAGANISTSDGSFCDVVAYLNRRFDGKFKLVRAVVAWSMLEPDYVAFCFNRLKQSVRVVSL